MSKYSDEPYVKFTHWNPRMTEITGYTMEEMNQAGWYQSMYPDPEIQQKAIERMAQMREGGDIQAEEWIITTKSGEKKALSISTSVVKKKMQTSMFWQLCKISLSANRRRMH